MNKIPLIFVATVSCMSISVWGDIILRFESRNEAEKKQLHNWLIIRKAIHSIQGIFEDEARDEWAPLLDIRRERAELAKEAVGVDKTIVIPNPSRVRGGTIESIAIERDRRSKYFFPVIDGFAYVVRLSPCSAKENTVSIFEDLELEEKAKNPFFCVEQLKKEAFHAQLKVKEDKEREAALKKKRDEEFNQFCIDNKTLKILPPALNSTIQEFIVGPQERKSPKKD